MNYWLYRIKKEEYEELDLKEIKIDFLPEDVNDDDKFLVHVAELGIVIGAYKKLNETFVLENDFKTRPKLKDMYEKFSFIDFVNERTYKVFAKKLKLIYKEDYEMVIKCAS